MYTRQKTTTCVLGVGGRIWNERETYSVEKYTSHRYLSWGLALRSSVKNSDNSLLHISACSQWNSTAVMEKQ